MKRLCRRFFAFILAVFLISGSAATAVGNEKPYDNHWAAETLNRAVGDSLITGQAADFPPDGAITGAQAAAILCRVLAAEKEADLSGLADIKKSDPHYKAAAQAVALGLISPEDGRLNLAAPLTRSRAFVMLADAFQLMGAAPDTSRLAEYSDGGALFGRYRTAAAALTAGEFVKGREGRLHSDEHMTLAEFLTILYRIVPNYRLALPSENPASGGFVLSDGVLAGKKFLDAVYFDCTVSNIALQNVEAPCVVVRGGSLAKISVTSSKIGRLVIAGNGDVSFSPDISSDIGTVAVGNGDGTVSLSGAYEAVEINGSERTVHISGKVEELRVSGSRCTVTIGAGAGAGVARILGSATGTRLTVNGNCSDCEIYGAGSAVDGSGRVEHIADNTSGSDITVKAAKTTVNDTYGLAGAEISINAPDTLPHYLSLNATADIKAPDNGISCKGFWYLDDVLMSLSDVVLGKTSSAALSYPVKNGSSAPVTAKLSFVLSYDDPVSGYQVLQAGKSIVLENAGKFDANDVLNLVTTGYKGDFTLKWAKNHDYEDGVKTAWVNYKGYVSKTEYLVWISIAYQRVNVFTGSAGNWKLDRSFIVGTGAPGHDTPVGVFKVIGRSAAGWTTKEYTVKPVIFFNTYAYGFHSRLYYPKTTKIKDAGIGYPISHGCIRMYDEDVAWFYDNIPTGTTVVVY